MRYKLNIIAHAYGDNKLLPFTGFTMYASEEEASKYARPPYHTPMNLEMVKNYLELEENELYAYRPRYIHFYHEQDKYGYYDDNGSFWEWDESNRPWDIDCWMDRDGRIPLYEIIYK